MDAVKFDDKILKHPIFTVEAVELWSAAHPQKTRKDDFLEKLPDSKKAEERDRVKHL